MPLRTVQLEHQDEGHYIYYITGDATYIVAFIAFMKRLKNRGLDVIFMMERVNKYVIQQLVSSTEKLEHLDLQRGLHEEEKKKMEEARRLRRLFD